MKRMHLVSAVVAVAVLAVGASAFAQDVTKYVRYEHDGATSYGVLEGETIHQLSGSVFESPERTGATVALADVTLLPPSEPKKVVAAGLNYRSHLGGAQPAEYPGLFDKHATSLIGHEAEITYYEDATNLHFEGEMVLIIGKVTRNVSVEDAPDHIFAVAPGNDISERVWQSNDLQWFRAKGADTFGPVGPVMARGVDYNDLLLQTRVNGQVMQSQRTRDLLFDSAYLVSYASRYVTLEPGDMIFTGTPGATSAMQPGDVVEIELENVGVLRNTIGPKGGRPTNEQ
ncbi:MAG: fumarylacetoacetate hydrolase family protein [Acidobacteria bacterium]|nr:fumarylacetoacetate hydrolase family protein [Acidobacteriota bacterium]